MKLVCTEAYPEGQAPIGARGKLIASALEQWINVHGRHLGQAFFFRSLTPLAFG